MRRVNAMLFLGKINNIITLFTPRSIQDLPMLIITSVGFSVFNLPCLMIYIIRNDTSQNNMKLIFVKGR